MIHTFWQLTEDRATVALDAFCGRIDLAQPHNGFLETLLAGQPILAAQLLGIAASSPVSVPHAPPQEAYVRGADLIAVYEASDAWPIRVDAVWRGIRPTSSEKFLAAVDLIVSVRTGLLDSRPELSVQSVIPASDVLRLQSATPFAATSSAPACTEEGLGCTLFRLPHLALSYAEMVHPADYQQEELVPVGASDSLLRISHQLFRTTLEKGVMLRARVRGVLLDRCDDIRIATECYAAFAAAEPPLGA
jgi:hypothetical protein